MRRSTEILFCVLIVVGFALLVWPPADMGTCGRGMEDTAACQHEAEYAVRVLVGIPVWVLFICVVGYTLETAA